MLTCSPRPGNKGLEASLTLLQLSAEMLPTLGLFQLQLIHLSGLNRPGVRGGRLV